MAEKIGITATKSMITDSQSMKKKEMRKPLPSMSTNKSVANAKEINNQLHLHNQCSFLIESFTLVVIILYYFLYYACQ